MGIEQDPEDDEMLVEVFESELKLVDTSKYSQFLVRGKDDTGNTALSLAAAEINSKMVSLLLERGSDVNNRNDQGRTPLMEAALWGRVEKIQILLQKDADKAIQDRSGYIASDFAAPHARNFEEILSRSGGRFKENTYEAEKQRRIIARMLDSQPPGSSISLAPANPPDDALNFLLFHKSPMTSSIKLCAPIADIPVPCQSKTVGLLDRGHPFPPIYAMSGWKHDTEDRVTISGKDWTEQVFRLCQEVGHGLGHIDEYGPPESFYPSHAEKQLIAYFFSKHMFLPDEIYGAGSGTEKDLQGLCLARPPVTLRGATILVSSAICSDCRNFVTAMTEFAGLTFHLKHC